MCIVGVRQWVIVSCRCDRTLGEKYGGCRFLPSNVALKDVQYIHILIVEALPLLATAAAS